MFLLDTNVVSESRKPRPHPAVVDGFGAHPLRLRSLAAITVAELQIGAERTRRGNPDMAMALDAWIDEVQRTYRVLPMDGVLFRRWARLMAGRSSDLQQDAMIAVTALEHGLTVVTRNVRDFEALGLT